MLFPSRIVSLFLVTLLINSTLIGSEKAVPTVVESKTGPQQTILFLDNWMLEKQVGLERVWGKPRYVKEVFSDIHPQALGFCGYASIFWDDLVGKYVIYCAVYPPEADPGTFVLRLESDDPFTWADPKYDTSVTPYWIGFYQVVVDEKGDRFWAIYINSLAGTPLADRGYISGDHLFAQPSLPSREECLLPFSG